MLILVHVFDCFVLSTSLSLTASELLMIYDDLDLDPELMDCNSADCYTVLEGQIFKPFDCPTFDSYNGDVDPDQNLFSTFDVSNLCSYYNELQFNELRSSMPANMFSSFHLNIRSLSCNYDNFFHYLSSLKHDFSVIALTETWLTQDIKEMFRLPNYNSAHYVRENRAGGGVSLFIHADYDFKIRDDLSLKTDRSDVESLFVELSIIDGKSAIVGVIYRPPDSVIKDFNEGLFCLLDRVNSENKCCFILGDFNLNLLKHNSDTLVEDYLNVLYSSYFFPLIHKPTRVKETSATLIDNILSNSLTEGMKSGILYTDLSDHFPIFQFSAIKTNKAVNSKEKMSKRIMSKKNISKFKNMLGARSWDELYEENNAEVAYQKFLDVFSFCFDECFPVVSFTKKNHQNFNKPINLIC